MAPNTDIHLLLPQFASACNNYTYTGESKLAPFRLLRLPCALSDLQKVAKVSHLPVMNRDAEISILTYCIYWEKWWQWLVALSYQYIRLPFAINNWWSVKHY